MPSPQSRLYLTLTNNDAVTDPEGCLKAAAEAGDVAALLIGAGTDGAKGLLAVAHAYDIAVIVDQDVALAKALDADGVEVGASLEAYQAARFQLGDDKIVGIAPTESRHAAMELAEAGAAYVSFADDPADPDSLSGWWAQVMEIPCVAHMAGQDDEVLSAAGAGIEFIRPDESSWRTPEAAAKRVAHLNQLIATAGAAE
ncbi:MAG: thiamine phosphate synthase [Pseudomonadota bacterium]